MKALILFMVALAFSCSPAPPRYQTTTSADGSTVTRIDTQTGKTEMLVAGHWKAIAEAPTPCPKGTHKNDDFWRDGTGIACVQDVSPAASQ